MAQEEEHVIERGSATAWNSERVGDLCELVKCGRRKEQCRANVIVGMFGKCDSDKVCERQSGSVGEWGWESERAQECEGKTMERGGVRERSTSGECKV